MRLLPRLQGLREDNSDRGLMCPVCGQIGNASEDVGEGEVGFLLVGDDHGDAVRRCYLCRSEFAVRGENTEPIAQSS
jgi:hypothetical protein